jgi:hypothetical protein
MTIGISRNRAAPDVGRVVMRALLVADAQNTEMATAGGRSERLTA